MTGFDLRAARNAQGANGKVFEFPAEAFEVAIFVHFLAIDFVTFTIEAGFKRFSAATATKARVLEVVVNRGNKFSERKRHAVLLSYLRIV